ncbi:MAG: serine hydrolase [Acidobacteria bacterium]|nr:serine hydrolase [Acidobacteriota bacterium]
MNKRFLLLIGFVIFLVFQAAAQDYTAKLAEIDAYAEKTRAEWNVPGVAVAIVKDDRVIFAKGYGVRDINKPDKVDADTLFAIASNSKAFTAASIAMLIAEKKIGGWDDKVSKYLPEFQMYDPWVTNELTIRDLLSHRSGLDTFSGDLLWYDTTYSADEILRRVRYLKPTSSFRTKYGYQNLMFLAAGRVVEKASGMPWAKFVEERILKPLKMKRTKMSVRNVKGNYASPHNESTGKLRALPLGKLDDAIGLVGLNSSVNDLANWFRMLLARGKFDGKQLIPEKLVGDLQTQNMFIPVNPFPAKEAPGQITNGYGLGFFIADYRGRKMLNHSGGLDGMISQTCFLPQEQLAVIVLTNSESSVSAYIRNKILDTMLDGPKRDWSAEALERNKAAKAREADEDKKKDASRVANTKPSLALKDYAGTYSSEMYGDVTIDDENGKLVMRLKPAPNFVADLEHWHYDTWLIKWRPTVNYNFPRGWVTFTLDGNGKTDQLKIDQPNNDFWFYELELKRK